MRSRSRSQRSSRKIRDVARGAHGERLAADTSAALARQDEERAQVDLDELRALGVIVTIEGVGGVEYPLRLNSLEQFSRHRMGPLPKWLLLTVTPASDERPEQAVVWISDRYREAFLQLFEDFLTKETTGGRQDTSTRHVGSKSSAVHPTSRSRAAGGRPSMRHPAIASTHSVSAATRSSPRPVASAKRRDRRK